MLSGYPREKKSLLVFRTLIWRALKVGYSTKTFTMMIISIERSYSGRKYFVKSVSSNRFSSFLSFFLPFLFSFFLFSYRRMFLHSIASNMAESELMTIRMQILKKQEKFLRRKLKKTVVGKFALNHKFM